MKSSRALGTRNSDELISDDSSRTAGTPPRPGRSAVRGAARRPTHRWAMGNGGDLSRRIRSTSSRCRCPQATDRSCRMRARTEVARWQDVATIHSYVATNPKSFGPLCSRNIHGRPHRSFLIRVILWHPPGRRSSSLVSVQTRRLNRGRWSDFATTFDGPQRSHCSSRGVSRAHSSFRVVVDAYGWIAAGRPGRPERMRFEAGGRHDGPG